MKKLSIALLFSSPFLASAQSDGNFTNAVDAVCKCADSEFQQYTFYLENLYKTIGMHGMDGYTDELATKDMSSADSSRYMEQSLAFDDFIDSDFPDNCLDEHVSEEDQDIFNDAIRNETTYKKALAYMKDKECNGIALFFEVLHFSLIEN